MTIKNALLSVYKKDGIEDLARELVGLDWTLYSSGGTAAAIAEAGLPVTDIAELTGVPAILGHRVVTLHPKVHGGILAIPDDPEHQADMAEHGIVPIGLVVSNLYPFAQAVAEGASPEDCIEKIDVGGPAMVRAAAKNHTYVGIVTSPDQYDLVLDELRANGELSTATRRKLARAAFAHTTAYDTAITNWLDREDGEDMPETMHISLTRAPFELRYGENPHMQAAAYRLDGTTPWWMQLEQFSGKPPSYLNLLDADAAWRLVHEPELNGTSPMCAIIKHTNPCGFATATTLAKAYQSAFECDTMSAFGGIVAFNRVIDSDTVAAMVAAAQADLVVAPGYGEGVVERLIARRKNTILLQAPPPGSDPLHLRQITNGLLVQEPHHFVATNPSKWQVVTKRHPTAAELQDGFLAFVLGGHVKSNSIVHVKGGVAWGIGAGQQNRLESARIATAKAAGRAKGGATGSDAFFPQPDGVEAAAEAGVALIVQPGGSLSDEKVIARADELGLAMVFTDERHFIH